MLQQSQFTVKFKIAGGKNFKELLHGMNPNSFIQCEEP